MKKNYFTIVVLFSVAAILFNGCASTQGMVFNYSLEKTQKAAVDALIVKGFDIDFTETTPTYVTGFRPRKMGMFIGSGGETMVVNLKSIDANNTEVIVGTQKTLVGIAAQKNWDQEVAFEIEKILKKK